jgi:transposase
MHDELNAERNKLTNRIREQLRRYFPAFLAVEPDPSSEFGRALFALIPTPEKAHAVKPYRVAKLLQKHRIRRIDADSVLARLREPALTLADGAARASVAHLEMLIERVALVARQQRTVLATIDAMLATPTAEEDSEAESKQRDVEILLSLPGAGRITVATLLSEAPRLLDDRDYQRLRALSGVAPVTKRSGKRIVVGMRHACHGRLRNAVYHWARVAAQHDPASKLRYKALRERGASHGRALRTVADRLLRAACAMLRDGTTWRRDEAPASEAA